LIFVKKFPCKIQGRFNGFDDFRTKSVPNVEGIYLSLVHEYYACACWQIEMARRQERTSYSRITYPPGCKELAEELGKEELLKRLKVGFM
jgi:hypothetical protein